MCVCQNVLRVRLLYSCHRACVCVCVCVCVCTRVCVSGSDACVSERVQATRNADAGKFRKGSHCVGRHQGRALYAAFSTSAFFVPVFTCGLVWGWVGVPVICVSTHMFRAKLICKHA